VLLASATASGQPLPRERISTRIFVLPSAADPQHAARADLGEFCDVRSTAWAAAVRFPESCHPPPAGAARAAWTAHVSCTISGWPSSSASVIRRSRGDTRVDQRVVSLSMRAALKQLISDVESGSPSRRRCLPAVTGVGTITARQQVHRRGQTQQAGSAAAISSPRHRFAVPAAEAAGATMCRTGVAASPLRVRCWLCVALARSSVPVVAASRALRVEHSAVELDATLAAGDYPVRVAVIRYVVPEQQLGQFMVCYRVGVRSISLAMKSLRLNGADAYRIAERVHAGIASRWTAICCACSSGHLGVPQECRRWRLSSTL